MAYNNAQATVEAIKARYRCGRPGCGCATGPNVHCPNRQAHSKNDATPSFGVSVGRSQPLIITCPICDTETLFEILRNDGVIERKGDRDPIALATHRSTKGGGKPEDAELVATYEYRDARGVLVAVKRRWEWGPVDKETGKRLKSFDWRMPDPQDRRKVGDFIPKDQMPLLGSDLVARSSPMAIVYFVEGEKARQACVDAGLVAVCSGYGSKQADFGASLEVLRDRIVRIWPDNAADGRAFGVAVARALKGIAKETQIISPPGQPEKGDAYEYFAAGRTVAALDGTQEITAPDLVRLAPDALAVRYPTERIGVATFTFTEMTRSTRALDAMVKIEFSDPRYETFSQRVNLESLSARKEFRLELDHVTGSAMKDGRESLWEIVILKVWGMARRAFDEYDNSIRLGEIEPSDPPGWYIQSILPKRRATVWFGDGASTKTFEAMKAMLNLATGDRFLDETYDWNTGGVRVKTQESVETLAAGVSSLYLDYENDQQTFQYRMDRVAQGEGVDPGLLSQLPIYYWEARGVPVAEMVQALAAKIERDNIQLLVIDSAALAAGGEPEKSESAIRFFGAISRLGADLTTLIIAHVPKDGDTRKPFGCYSEDTEFLSRDGWHRHDEWREGMEIAAFDPVSGSLRWESPHLLNAYPYGGPMIRFLAPGTDVLVTPNHRMMVKPAWGAPKGDLRVKYPRGWSFVEANALGGSPWLTPYAVPFDHNESPRDSIAMGGKEYAADSAYRMLGWWLAEGSLNDNALQFAQAQGPLADAFKATLSGMGIDYNVTEKRYAYAGREHELPMCYIRTRGTVPLAKWIEQHCGKGAENKRIPRIVWPSTNKHRRILLEALIDGDGTRKRTGAALYCTCSPQLADDVQQLAIELGHSATIRRDLPAEVHHLPRYTVKISRPDRGPLTLRTARHQSIEQYAGTVYCFTTPSGAYLTRRNGKIAIQGNSAFWSNLPRLTVYVEKLTGGKDAVSTNPEMIDVRMIPRKINNDRLPLPVGITLDFHDGEGKGAPIDFRGLGSPVDTITTASKKKMPERLRDYITKNPGKTRAEIREALELLPKTANGSENPEPRRSLNTLESKMLVIELDGKYYPPALQDLPIDRFDRNGSGEMIGGESAGIPF